MCIRMYCNFPLDFVHRNMLSQNITPPPWEIPLLAPASVCPRCLDLFHVMTLDLLYKMGQDFLDIYETIYVK